MLDDGSYRAYNVTLTGDRFVYTAAGRFKIADGFVWVLDDPTGILSRYVKSGPLTLDIHRFLQSYVRGSYRHVIMEQAAVVYLPSYAQLA